MEEYGNIIEVNEPDFEYQVIAYSQRTPVVVDFWAEWCIPCRTLGPLLERLAEEANGEFRLAKVNIDDNPNLARLYNIRSIPYVKGFRNGQAAAEFIGALPEAQVREFLQKLIPDEGTLETEKGFSLLADHQPLSAETAFRQALAHNSNDIEALLGLARSLLYQGKSQDALAILRVFPISKPLSSAETLLPLAEALEQQANMDSSENGDLDAEYSRALLLTERGNFPAALDGLIDILRTDKRYRAGVAHKVILGIFELLGNQDPLTIEYRRELSSVLF
jgi:putative thioredoxin